MERIKEMNYRVEAPTLYMSVRDCSEEAEDKYKVYVLFSEE